MPKPTPIDSLRLYRVRAFLARDRRLARTEAELLDELVRVSASRRAAAAIIRSLVGPDEAASRPHRVFVDGASRGHPRTAAAGFIIEDAASGASKEGAKALGPLGCNEAEFSALVVGLEAALAAGLRRVEVHSDSSAVVRAMRGEHTIRARNLRPLYERAVELASRFETVTFKHIPRTENRRADKLASGALTKPGRRAA